MIKINKKELLKQYDHWHYITRDLLQHEMICDWMDTVRTLLYDEEPVELGSLEIDPKIMNTRYLSSTEIAYLMKRVLLESLMGKKDTYLKIIDVLENGTQADKELVEEYNTKYGNER